MKLLSIIKKSIKEYLRSFWLLLLMVSMAPFFVFIYYLFVESENQDYDLLILNNDAGIELSSDVLNHGDLLIEYLNNVIHDSLYIPINVIKTRDLSRSEDLLESKRADALVIIPEDFSEKLTRIGTAGNETSATAEIVGDLTDMKYMFCAILTNELIQDYIYESLGTARPLRVTETALGVSGEIDEFDMYMPGIFILSIIMIMFTAMIAFVAEVETKTMIRLRLSKITVFEYLCGVSVVQIMIGFLSVFLTLLTAMSLGFDFKGGIGLFLLIALLTSISIIAFSLLAAAFMKTVNEVLIIGNFPLFLFMFFTGAMFPTEGTEMFTIGGYSITIQGLMSPTHSVIALRKVMVMNMGFMDILPEMTALLTITIIYFVAGIWLFDRRHMKIS
ncbi:MAG: ABC transporter permease [bacterium]|nr:ABC transporter permease [bacterium]